MAGKTTFGPGWVEQPSMQITPSRVPPICPHCFQPVDLHRRHAVVHEKFDGRLVSGRYAHLVCAKRRFGNKKEIPNA